MSEGTGTMREETGNGRAGAEPETARRLTGLPLFTAAADPAAVPEGLRALAGGTGPGRRPAPNPVQTARAASADADPAALPGWALAPSGTGPSGRRARAEPVEQPEWETVAQLRAAVSTLLAEALHADPGMDEEQRRRIARSHIAELVAEHAESRLRSGGQRAAWSPAMRERIAEAVFDALFRLGRLQPLLDDPEVENIDIYGCDNVWISRADGTRRRGAPVADSDADLIADIAFLARRGGEDGRSFTPSDPILDMDLPGNARLAAVHPPVSPRPKVVIRVHRFVDIGLPELVRERDTLGARAAAFLAAAVRAGVSIVVSGAPGSGKTTLVRALAGCIPPEEEIVTIEKERELHLDRMGDRHLIVTPLQYRPGQGETGAGGRRPGEVTLVDLLEEALRLNAERIIVGEVRGGEVDAMFQAMQAGVGSISTLHANSPSDAIERLAGLCLKALGTSEAYAYRQIAQHIGLIVQIVKTRDGHGRLRRRVTRIAEIQPGEAGTDGALRPIAADLFRARTPDGPAEPHAPPSRGLLERLARHGLDPAALRADGAGRRA
ncbi:MAG: type II/IV secretion system ATPase subunit [Pseudoclavibacter sp.]|nr:type II/IV secretion system ATPase subunit [Pseudoclavibacter sp.]